LIWVEVLALSTAAYTAYIANNMKTEAIDLLSLNIPTSWSRDSLFNDVCKEERNGDMFSNIDELTNSNTSVTYLAIFELIDDLLFLIASSTFLSCF